MQIIGIDPGKKGGVVALDITGRPTATEWTAADHPEEGYVAGKAYNVRRMVQVLEEIAERGEVALVVLERQQARPIEGRSSCLTTGYGWGLWSGIVHALRLPLLEVSLTWGRRRKPHDGLSDAGCLALFGLAHVGPVG